MIRVEVVYARPERQTLVEVDLPEGATAADAVRQCGILEAHPEIVWPGTPVGVFGRRIAPEAALVDGDRVEIYRPLTADPKERRRRRARGDSD